MSESSQERVNWVVSHSWLLTAQTNIMEKLIYLNNWYTEQIDNTVLNGKQNVFFTTNNALKNIIYSLHLLVRKVKEVRWLKFAYVIFHSFRILNSKKETRTQNPRKVLQLSYNQYLLYH